MQGARIRSSQRASPFRHERWRMFNWSIDLSVIVIPAGTLCAEFCRVGCRSSIRGPYGLFVEHWACRVAVEILGAGAVSSVFLNRRVGTNELISRSGIRLWHMGTVGCYARSSKQSLSSVWWISKYFGGHNFFCEKTEHSTKVLGLFLLLESKFCAGFITVAMRNVICLSSRIYLVWKKN